MIDDLMCTPGCRCLYYMYDKYGEPIEEDAECYGNEYTYYKMKTASGKSKGWGVCKVANMHITLQPPCLRCAF
jgi:hypothetical protein